MRAQQSVDDAYQQLPRVELESGADSLAKAADALRPVLKTLEEAGNDNGETPLELTREAHASFARFRYCFAELGKRWPGVPDFASALEVMAGVDAELVALERRLAAKKDAGR